MEILNLAEKIIKNFDGDAYDTHVSNPKRLTVSIRKESLLEIAFYFSNELRFRFIIATAMITEKGYEILYHFSNDSKGEIINLRIELEREKPAIDSLANLIHAANWIEREMHDLFGIQFLNHPGPGQFIANGNWPEDMHPYSTPNREKTKET